MKAVLLSGIILREFGNNGKLGSGFKLAFYESQTDIKKAVYTDVNGTVPATNPVICDASGYPGAIYGKGLYRVILLDNFDNQVVPPIDGFGADIGADGEAKYAACLTYDEVRALTADYDFAYVCGRDEVGDGGQGLFQRITESETDDDGVVLTNSAGNVIWKRVFSGYIDARWYGLQYNAILSQSSALEKAMLGSYRFHIPLRLTDHVYIDQSIEFVEGSALVADEGAVITSTYNNSILISGDSDIKGRLFGENITANFGSRYTKIYVSWFGGQTDDDRLLKLYQAATNSTQILVVNETLNIGTDINISQPFTFEGGVINVNAGCENLWLYEFLDPSYIAKIFNVTTTLTSLIIGRRHILPEYFGAKGDGSTNDSAAFQLACMNRLVKVIAGHTYKLSTMMTLPDTLEIVGAGILNIQQNNLNCTTLTLDQCSVTYSGSELWFEGTNLFATNCTISNKYTVSNTKVINGCAYSESTLYPIFDGNVGPAIYNTHLPLIPGSAILGTDANGKIKNNAESNYKFNGGLWDCISGFGAYGRKMSRIRYVQGRYWILGTAGYLGVSDDAITWTRVSIPNTTDILQDLIWNGTYYVLSSCLQGDGTDNYSIWRSLDGVNWTGGKIYNPAWTDESGTFQLSFVNNQVRNIAYNGSTIVVGAAHGYILVSTDHGATFTPVKMQIGSNAWTGESWIGYITGQWVICDANGNWYYSDELVYNSFTKVGSGTANDKVLLMHWNGSTYKVIYSFGAVYTYTDLDRGGAYDDWTIIPQGPNSFNDAYTANGLYVMAGAAGIATYYEGVDAWTPRNVPGVNLVQDSVGTPGVGCGGSPNGELFIISDRYVFRTT